MDPHLTERLNQHTETQGDHYRYRGAHRNLPLRTAAPDPPPPPLTPPPSSPPSSPPPPPRAVSHHAAPHSSRTRAAVTVTIACTALCALVGGPLSASTATDVRALHPIPRHHGHARTTRPARPTRCRWRCAPTRRVSPIRVVHLVRLLSAISARSSPFTPWRRPTQPRSPRVNPPRRRSFRLRRCTYHSSDRRLRRRRARARRDPRPARA
jgi:hypothetical protein